MGKIELTRLGPSHRVLTIGFLTTLGLAYLVALLFVFVQSDMKPQGIAAQYRGSTEVTETPAESTSDQNASEEQTSEQVVDEAAVPALADEWKTRARGMKFPKSFKDMILTTHLHMLSISMILFLLGGVFAFSSASEKTKVVVIASGFISLVLTYASMWALRYGAPGFSTAVFLFGVIQGLSMAIQFLISLRDLLFSHRHAHA